ncbi:MAG: adenylosuccinate lyase [Marinilabiliales bacterium]|nr:MAG: adenylosuccinate lyase [Marinilabiliales bacterium]
MDIGRLSALSPVDGRYRQQADELAVFFSEYALIRYRIYVEVEYFIALTDIPLPQLKDIKTGDKENIRKIYDEFKLEDALRVKEAEKITNHDIKAVEYYIKDAFRECGLDRYVEFVHFGLTSQDINNTAIPLSVRDALREVYYPVIETLIDKLKQAEIEWSDVPMLARTHGQPASPTRLGKEIRVFNERIVKQAALLREIPCSAKFGGATGNFNAHYAAYPGVDWIGFANQFVNGKLGLDRSQVTTQIEHYDNLAAIFDNLKRINTILVDLCRDFWSYISMDYFSQEIRAEEVGSSAMPHKVNPIDFENAEGNLGIANAVFEHLSAKLPISRLQRDLTDSTVLRNVGVPLAHTVIAIKAIMRGLNKLSLNMVAIEADLQNNWMVIAEGVQTILRREGYPEPYEALKKLTRQDSKITEADFARFVNSLDIDDRIKEELKMLTPFNYTGIKP